MVVSRQYNLNFYLRKIFCGKLKGEDQKGGGGPGGGGSGRWKGKVGGERGGVDLSTGSAGYQSSGWTINHPKPSFAGVSILHQETLSCYR